MENTLQNNAMSPEEANKMQIPPLRTDVQETKVEKLREYENMFKILYKQKDYAKINSLAEELKNFDPGNKSAEKWLAIADKKLSGRGFFGSFLSRFKKPKLETEISPMVEVKAVPLVHIAPELTQQNMATSPSVSMAVSSEVTPIAVKPALIIGPISSPVSTPIPSPTPPVSSSKKPEENTFTRMFGGKTTSQATNSIIDRIVAKTEKKEKTAPLPPNNSFKPVQPKKEFNLLSFSKLFMNFTAVFVFLTGTFLYVDFLDQKNTFLGMVGIEENTGSKLHSAAEKLDQTKHEVAVLEAEIQKYKTGYKDPSLATVQSIIDNRINWPDIMFKIKEVTNSVYELNDFFKYVEYDNYSFDAEKQTIRITGHLTDPQERNLTKLVELEEAFMYYPKDKNNADDPTKPFFQGFKELTALSKSIDNETGRFTSDFQLSFSLNPDK